MPLAHGAWGMGHGVLRSEASGKPLMISTRALSPADHVELAALFEEMQAHYRVDCPSPHAIIASLQNLPAVVEILVAEAHSRIVGFAAFSSIYPGPGLGSGLFLKELFVSEPSRGSGVGRQLMRALARIAMLRGHKRVDWTADGQNPRLLAFYESLGAAPKTEKVFYRLEGEALTVFED
jgi:GNAT superfamily N-acetyltransferase